MSHETVKAYIFTSDGEYVDDSNIVELEWTAEGVLELLIRCYTDYKCGETCETMFDSGPVQIRDTIQQVYEGMYQAIECSCAGGMIYIVRIYD